MSILPFDQRACLIAGQAKSGASGRRAQFDYLTQQSFARILFGGQARWGKHDYKDFPQQQFFETFERSAFDPANANRDLLVLMIESYAAILGVPLDRIKRWVEKTPANRNYIAAILARFPQAKLLVTMRDPRAIMAAQIALEKTRKTKRFSVYYVIAHWLVAARLAKRVRNGEITGCVVPFEQLVRDPANMMQKVCSYLEIAFDPRIVLKPPKVGQVWSGNSAAAVSFSEISAEPATRWEHELSRDEIGWVEWHCAELMPEFGYQPRASRREMRHWIKPIPGERPREYLKSRAYSL